MRELDTFTAEALQSALADAGTYAALKRAEYTHKQLAWALEVCRELLEENKKLRVLAGIQFKQEEDAASQVSEMRGT